MAVFAVEVSRVLADRSLEISFANALSTVSSSAGADQNAVEAALQAQLMTYAGLEEIESATGSLSLPEGNLPPGADCVPSLKLPPSGSGEAPPCQQNQPPCLDAFIQVSWE